MFGNQEVWKNQRGKAQLVLRPKQRVFSGYQLSEKDIV
jgi:hypothetical protein